MGSAGDLMATRVCPPDGKAVQIDVGNRRYAMNKGAMLTSDSDAKRIVAEGGFIPGTGMADIAAGRGYRCGECGFGSWFRTCGRCGANCDKEASDGRGREGTAQEP